MKKTFNAVFSFFDPDEKEYFDCCVKVNATDRYEAREKAWPEFEKNYSQYLSTENSAEQVKLCGIHWQGNPLDIQDYFDAHSDFCKCEMNRIKNVDLVNCRLDPDLRERRYEEFQRNLYSEAACRHAYDGIAKDLHLHQGIVPPSVHTELYYAEKMAESLFYKGENDLANKLVQNICDAEQWNSGAMCTITELFREQCLYHEGSHHSLDVHFARDGCYPCATTQIFEGVRQAESHEMGGIS